MPFEQWWAWVWTNDYTILMTNDEHNGKKQKSQVYPLNPTDSYFVDTEVAGWHQTIAREGAFIRTLCEEHGISY